MFPQAYVFPQSPPVCDAMVSSSLVYLLSTDFLRSLTSSRRGFVTSAFRGPITSVSSSLFIGAWFHCSHCSTCLIFLIYSDFPWDLIHYLDTSVMCFAY